MNNRDLLKGLPDKALAPEEEQTLAANKTDENKEKLILHAMRDAFLYGNKCGKRLPEDEIYSACYTALSRAVKNFRPGMIRFIGYSKPFIRGEINRAWKRKDVVRNSSQHETIPMVDGADAPVYGSDDPITAHLKSGNFSGLGQDGLVDTSAENSITDSLFTAEMMEIIEPIMNQHLTPREREVIGLRFEQELSFGEIGSLLGVSRSRAQASLTGALDKIRRALKFSGKNI